ncbi:transposase, partial [Shigella flexneri]|nr:transposase [Shigella flexneri]EFY0477907.1 transposase [Shigella flexneri]
QMKKRALYPRPEGRAFTVHWISLEIIYTCMDIIVRCPVHAPSHPQHQSIRALQTIMRLSLSHLSYAKKIELISSGAILRIK